MMKRFVKTFFVPLLAAGILTVTGCGSAASAPQITISSSYKPTIAVCWNNAQTSYSYESTFAAVKELDVNTAMLFFKVLMEAGRSKGAEMQEAA